MADTKVASPPPLPAMTPGKIAMSRSLGAAFLAHQVEQLEKSVDARGGYAPRGRNGRRPPGRAPAPANNSNNFNGRGAKIAVRGGGFVQARQERNEKDADIVVVDASVLIHALGQVKKWCRDGREETIIVPLEALNTLDLLKKGTSVLAQRARAASRALEAQVGVNPRMKVQQDNAFVLWDTITLAPVADGEPVQPAPEWLRRTVCCAQYETNEAGKDTEKKPTVIFATLAHAPVLPRAASPPNAGDSPVPLPVPQANKHEPRATGALVNYWARRAGLTVHAVEPTPEYGPPANANGHGHANGNRRHSSSEEESRPNARGPPRRRIATAPDTAEKTRPLVERPPAVKAMMDSVAQPSRAIRVLARGEKLEP
ncbi:hypothetical protein PENSPDRAFT_662026 [Peniophora sp. CONT]|nr:hypothetical protein PENSPDRAFT_662026 [Peniophora sp. CONT]